MTIDATTKFNVHENTNVITIRVKTHATVNVRTNVITKVKVRATTNHSPEAKPDAISSVTLAVATILTSRDNSRQFALELYGSTDMRVTDPASLIDL